uniref:Sulfate/tungstate ABC transporter permease (TupB, vupB) n=1 Tax=uncultured marine thaumarchaeote KM3_73_F02 TaxID=1456268 RepID=A0A075HM23_9ARCH|nr:sulfate/tungstate ABC transporter permease (tupB, vupB) [uncultured marine thaumarchaeote KM3_73_F02]
MFSENAAELLQFTAVDEIILAVILSIAVSGSAVMISIAIGLPLGATIGLKNFKGKAALITFINALMGIPPVLGGLLVFLLLSRTGPLGFLQLLFTPEAMVIAQVVIVTPIITGLVQSSVSNVDRKVKDMAISLGASQRQLTLTILREARRGIISAVVVGFGRAISEVGAILMVGGGIRFLTRNLTVGLFLAVELGELSLALSLGIILLVISFAVNLFLTYLQRRELL